MSISRILINSDETEAIRLDLQAVNAQSQYIIRNIVGLDADEIVPRFYGFSKDGTKRFYDFKLRQRELVIRVVLNPRYSVGEDNSYIRNQLYKVISATRTGLLELEFYSGASAVYTVSGHIIKFEVAYFSNEPELQLTIRCNDPMFRGLNPVVLGPADLPGTNPVIIADSVSSAPHGFKMELTVTATLANFTIQDKATDPEWDFKVTPSTSFLSGDKLYFSSEFNDRYLYMVRSAATTHLLDRIEPESVWPLVFPGFNSFHFTNIASFDWDDVHFNSAFWGV